LTFGFLREDSDTALSFLLFIGNVSSFLQGINFFSHRCFVRPKVPQVPIKFEHPSAFLRPFLNP